jgi:hypothetical protein
MIAQMIRAVLFAIATVATLVGFRVSRSASRMAGHRPRMCSTRCRRPQYLPGRWGRFFIWKETARWDRGAHLIPTDRRANKALSPSI